MRLADSKGDVVLVVFWATWCAPNAEEAERLGVLEAAYRGKGLRILGINLDPMQDGGVPAESVMPNVRRFLVDHNVRWPNLLNGPGDRDYAKAFGVTEIPANALIGRDGTVLHLDLTAATLEPAVAKALGAEAWPEIVCLVPFALNRKAEGREHRAHESGADLKAAAPQPAPWARSPPAPAIHRARA